MTRPALHRELGLGQLVVYGLVFISPIAPFAFFGIIYNASAGMAPLAYIAGTAAMIFTALSYKLMTEKYPVAGSVYIYASRALGPLAGFVAGWILLFDYILMPALICIGSALAVHAIFPAVPEFAVVATLLAVSTFLNLRGVSVAARVNLILLFIQLAILAVVLAIALRALAHGDFNARFSLAPIIPTHDFTLATLLGSTSLVILSFLGFDAISLFAEEAKGGRHTVGIATLLALVICSTLFILQTYVISLFVLGRTGFAPGDATYSAFYDISNRIGGPSLKALVSIPGVVLQGIAAIIAGQAATARLLYGMARGSALPRILARVSAGTGVPYAATIAVTFVTVFLAALFLDDLETLTSMVSIGALTGFAFLHVSVISHFVRERPRPSAINYLLIPVLGLIVVIYVLLSTQIAAKIAGLAWTAIGLFLYLILWIRRRPAPKLLAD